MMDDLQRDIMLDPDTFFALHNDLLRVANYYLSTFVKAVSSRGVQSEVDTLDGLLEGIQEC
jgi:hypothetical protein